MVLLHATCFNKCKMSKKTLQMSQVYIAWLFTTIIKNRGKITHNAAHEQGSLALDGYGCLPLFQRFRTWNYQCDVTMVQIPDIQNLACLKNCEQENSGSLLLLWLLTTVQRYQPRQVRMHFTRYTAFHYVWTYQELEHILHMDTRCRTIQVKQLIWTKLKTKNPISTVGGALKSSSSSSYFAFCRPHLSLIPNLTQNWTLSWRFLNQILIHLILIQMTPASAAALWGVACSSSTPSGSPWYRQDQWRWRNWWRTLCSLDDPWGRLTRRNLAC